MTRQSSDVVGLFPCWLGHIDQDIHGEVVEFSLCLALFLLSSSLLFFLLC